MKRLFLIVLFVSTAFLNAFSVGGDDEGVIRGYDGGMMLHTGYLNGIVLPFENHRAEGVPMGIGGALRVHMGDYLRVGFEGYTSSLPQLDNGSYVKCFWTGLLADCRWVRGRWMPYWGATVGGGKLTSFFMADGKSDDWEKEDEAIFNKQSFFAVDPFIGCDYIVSDSFHLTLKVDWLCGFGGDDFYMPAGPRLYLGFIFFH